MQELLIQQQLLSPLDHTRFINDNVSVLLFKIKAYIPQLLLNTIHMHNSQFLNERRLLKSILFIEEIYF